MRKVKLISFLLMISLPLILGTWLGWKANEKLKKPIIVEKIEPVKVPIKWDNPEYVAMCFKKGAEDYGVNEAFFWAVKECEGCGAYKVSPTGDYGELCLNYSWAKKYGAKDLDDIQDPCKATELAVKFLKDKKGLQNWTRWKCIQEKLIFIPQTNK
jgi:hypothetical protein